MATTSRKPTAWDELAALDERVEEAKAREAEAKATQGRARRAVDTAQSELAAYFSAVEAEERPADPDEEARLIAQHRDAEAAAAEAVAVARVSAAVTKREELEEERAEWGYANAPRLVAELAPRAVEAKERIEATYAEHEAAGGEYAALQRLAVRVARFAELPPEDVPGHPDRGELGEVAARYARGVDLPLPRTLMARQEEVPAN